MPLEPPEHQVLFIPEQDNFQSLHVKLQILLQDSRCQHMNTFMFTGIDRIGPTGYTGYTGLRGALGATGIVSRHIVSCIGQIPFLASMSQNLCIL